MAMSRYYERFYIQESISVPTGFPPPGDVTFTLGDGADFMGVYIPDSSTEMLVAGAQGFRTRGRFVTAPNVPLRDNTVVRRASDSVFIRIIGDAKQSPEQAVSQVKVFTAEIRERPS